MYERKALFGPITRVPVRARRSRCAYSRYATRCRPTAVFPVPGAPWTQMVPVTSERTISSCSGWMVATMSRIGPTRGFSISAASRAEAVSDSSGSERCSSCRR